MSFKLDFETLSLPRLKYLSLENCRFIDPDSQIHLPSLRHLAYIGFHPFTSLSAADHAVLNKLSSAPLLRSITLALTSARSISKNVASFDSLCFSAYLSRPGIRDDSDCVETLQLTGTIPHNWTKTDFERFDKWIELVEGAGKLKILILPPFPDDLQNEKALEKERQLIEVCERRKIRLIREEPGSGSLFWRVASPWFIKESERFHEGGLTTEA
ncbi:hypothetical protein JCM5350_007208 [Sporobolomyces pararoseus]